MLYCGLDLHAKSSTFCLVTRRGKRIAEGEVPTSPRGFEGIVRAGGGEEVRVVLEASTRTGWAAKVPKELGAEVILVDARKIRVIAETKHKTDRTDARILADLLRTGALPKALWRAPAATRELRDQLRLRWGLVRQRASLMLRARSLLASVGIRLGRRALASEATWHRVLKRRDVPASLKRLLEILYDTIQALSEAIEQVQIELAPRLKEPAIERMCTIPGVGPVVALTTCAGLGDPGRFPNARKAAGRVRIHPPHTRKVPGTLPRERRVLHRVSRRRVA